MEWGKTKTIFIIVFLILDIFLLTVFIKKHSASQFEIITETSIEDKLKVDNIDYNKTLQNEVGKAPLITAKTKTFTKKEIELLNRQKITLSNDQTILSAKLDKPYKLNKLKKDEIESFVKNFVLYGEHYQLWDYDKDLKKITLYQHFKGHLLFINISGQLTLKLSDDDEIIGYEQTLLEGMEENGKEEVLPAIQAVKTLYKNGMLKPNSEISEVDLGYYTLVQFTESQVLSPTWHFAVKYKGDVEHYFINAFDGSLNQKEKES
ncbi:regulatory protein YycI of two-component signal transduction system YycFG [Oikeobacillus pervagus]|uniref:Regulatory protein YycI of two-component signal transduction system YycFG n=1 Tax=Oikeobacillus pervagus TaxID=1325931 RepID=A0AAJ1T1C4_9BACI|nr:two-component system regulatory protein YycI [Oikeobacillus pervagus]MDQ0215382.1 regulatory protein YycI of two-component signal transduction system YycFG [Oikeobacillus pervagus]